MKQILLLLLLPCFAMAQYQGNANQKITLGEQTTADGLVYRGVENDTALITPRSDTSAYIILDTVSNRFFHYKRNTNVWSVAGGSDTSLIAYVNTYGTQTVNGAKTFTDTMRVEDAIKVGANNAYVLSNGTGNYYFTKHFKNQSGRYTIAIGDGVLNNATTLDNVRSGRHGTVAIGYNNLQNMVQSSTLNDGAWNTSVGYNNMSSLTTGNLNTAIGAESMKSLTTGFSNSGLGSSTLESSTTGERNLAIGNGALRFIVTGNDNIGIGSNAGIFAPASVTSFDNCIYIGSRADPSAITGVTNEIVIGKDGKGQGSNSVNLGNSLITKTVLYGNIGIGTTSPTEKLHVFGNARITSMNGINDIGASATGVLQAATSDMNLKNTIENSPFGLNEILLLNPVTFLYNDENRKIDSDVKEVGFIAQDVFDVIPNAVSSTGTGDLQLDYRAITAALVKAIQEQNALIKALEQRILILENK